MADIPFFLCSLQSAVPMWAAKPDRRKWQSGVLFGNEANAMSLVLLHFDEKIFRLLLKISVQKNIYEFPLIFDTPPSGGEKTD